MLAPAYGRSGSGDLVKPLSAQANVPRRPSGAAKKQKPGKNAVRGGRSRNSGQNGRFPVSAVTLANHLYPFPDRRELSTKTVDGWLHGRLISLLAEKS